MSSYLYHPFIHSFWFISLISFPGLHGLFPFTALNVHLNLAIFDHSLCVTSIGKVGKFVSDIGSSCDLSDKRDWSGLLSDWVWGRGIYAGVGEGMFETCVHLQIKAKQNIFRL